MTRARCPRSEGLFRPASKRIEGAYRRKGCMRRRQSTNRAVSQHWITGLIAPLMAAVMPSIAGKNLPYHFDSVFFNAQAIKAFSTNGYVTVGTWPNFDSANAVVGNFIEIKADNTFKPNNKLEFGVLYLKSRLDDKATGRRIFNQEIIRNRVVFQFTRNTFVRSILEYDTLKRSISVSELFGYTPRPNTAVYVGYGDFLYNGFDPIAQTRSPGLFRLRRSFFMKLSYNYRYLFGNRRVSARNSIQGATSNVFSAE